MYDLIVDLILIVSILLRDRGEKIGEKTYLRFDVSSESVSWASLDSFTRS